MISLSSVFKIIEASAEVLEVENYSEIFLDDRNVNSRMIAGRPDELLRIEIELGYLVVWYMNHATRIEIHNFSRPNEVSEYLTLVSPPFRDRFCDDIFLLDKYGLIPHELECLTFSGKKLKFDPESDLDFPALWKPGTAKLVWKYGG